MFEAYCDEPTCAQNHRVKGYCIYCSLRRDAMVQALFDSIVWV